MSPITQNRESFAVLKTHLFFRYAKSHYTKNLIHIKFKLKNEATGVALIIQHFPPKM